MTDGALTPGGLTFLASAAIVYVAFLAHAILARGPRVGIGFFAGAALLAFGRDLWFAAPFKSGMPYEFLLEFRILGVPPVAFVGWTITFYLSWCVGEAVANRWAFTAGRIFPTLAIAYLVAVAVSFAVEPTGVAAGLWRWHAFDESSIEGIGDLVSTYGPITGFWAFWVAQILAIYWLIEGSEYLRRPWRFLAFGLLYAFRPLKFLGPIRFLTLFPLLFLVLAVTVRTRFDWPARPNRGPLVRGMPFAAGFLMAVSLLAIDLVACGRLDLALSKVPLLIALVVGSLCRASGAGEPRPAAEPTLARAR